MIQYLSGVEPGELGKLFKKSKAERKERRKKFLKNPLKAVKTIAIAPARAAFLLAVTLNALKLAKRLAQAYKKNPQKIKDFWKKFGGNEAKLKKAIEKGSKSTLSGSHFGSVAAALATATPVIVSVLKVLKDIGADKQGDGDEDKDGVNDLKNELEPDSDDDKTTTDTTDTTSKPFYKNPFIIGGAVILVGTGIYFATKKK